MDLERTQVLSLATKAITIALGAVQALLVVHFLTKSEYGLVGLVMAIGSVVGVTQHLGVVDGAIREIAVLKRREEIGKVFWVSHLVRQAVTLPLTVGLIALAGIIAVRLYGRSEIVPYIQIFAASLILQGLQDVLGATLTGMKNFISLYVVQIATALINIAVFGYMTWQFGVTGFFWAVIITTAIMVAVYAAIVARDLRGHLAWPTRADFQRYSRRVMRIGVYMYAARIFFVIWQRLPLLLLGGVLTDSALGELTLSFTFGSKLTIVAMALSEVNLSWMSSLYSTRRGEFARVVTRNMQRVLILMMGLTLGLIFFTPEILRIPMLEKYAPAHHLVIVMTAAFFLYALIDIGTSSVFVPADKPRLRTVIYGVMTLVTAGIITWLLFGNPSPFWAAMGVLAGAGVGYVLTVIWAQMVFHVRLITWQLAIFLAALFGSVAWLFTDPAFAWRIVVFLLLAGYIWFETKRSRLLPPISRLWRSGDKKISIIGFGTTFDLPSWTNRQHVLSRLAHHYPVLYVEPREWIVRYYLRHWRNPKRLFSFFWRLVGYQRHGSRLYVVSQWNLIPGSREYQWVAIFNHLLNRWRIKLIAGWLGFESSRAVLWLYETEAAEYLSAWPSAKVFYDCVDDHAAQAGAERNTERVKQEEAKILQRADIVTVTSRRLYKLKRGQHANVHLVLNAGDVEIFLPGAGKTPGVFSLTPGVKEAPTLGIVGALDGYKVDFELLEQLAKSKAGWQLILIGEPVVDKDRQAVDRLMKLPNVKWIGPIARERVPAYVHHFDVCLIPYRANQYNAASFPLKFWEFMATGKPVVATGVPELKEYQSMIGYAEHADEFIRMCDQALQNPSQGAQERIALAREHSWEKRVEKLLQLLHTIV